MQDFYSQKKPELLLHRLIELETLGFNNKRVDLTPTDWNLQASVINWDQNGFIENHIHKNMERIAFDSAAQEMWMILSGTFEIKLYDIDGSMLNPPKIIAPGTVVFSTMGYHSMRALQGSSRFLEIKSGPYVGRDIEGLN